MAAQLAASQEGLSSVSNIIIIIAKTTPFWAIAFLKN
jgi:hypothetical protein